MVNLSSPLPVNATPLDKPPPPLTLIKMVSYRLVAAAGFFASSWALPLNINLGAYSPALYVPPPLMRGRFISRAAANPQQGGG